MTATIYVTKPALVTAMLLKDLDYYDRLTLSDDDDFSKREGYYLKNANALELAAIPEAVTICAELDFDDPAFYDSHVSMPTHLRGCIFENAPHLPELYAEIVKYWSGPTINANDGGAVYFQNPLNEYMVDISALNCDSGADQSVGSSQVDDLLSEGVVVRISGLGHLTHNAPANSFVRITIPIDETVIGNESEVFRTEQVYRRYTPMRFEEVYLLVSDIRSSPSPDNIYIDLIRHELLDYGYFY